MNLGNYESVVYEVGFEEELPEGMHRSDFIDLLWNRGAQKIKKRFLDEGHILDDSSD